MATGREKFRKYTAGHMIMARTEEILFRKLNLLEPMSSIISSGNKSDYLMDQDTVKQSSSFRLAAKLKDYLLLVKFNLSFMVVFRRW